MPMSEYVKDLRLLIGPRLLLAPSVTGLVFDDAGRVLLVRHSNGNVWVAPGGAVDPDEAPQDAVVREVWEETGLHVEPIRLCGVFGGPDYRVTYENGDETSYVTTVYECRRISGVPQADGEETLEARWFATSELSTVALSRWAKVLLPVLMDRADHAWLPPVAWRPPVASPG
jgi:8-oxo-dGTP pyrophosphatase MutT (NUDIX family)